LSERVEEEEEEPIMKH